MRRTCFRCWANLNGPFPVRPMAFRTPAALVAWLERSLARMSRCVRCRGKGIVLSIWERRTSTCDKCEGLGVTIK